jgi:tetratricopeptide (TPR) repeat protein
VLIEHARMADRRGDWVEARARWAEVATRFPDLWDGFGGQVRSLRAEGCLDEAETVLTAAAGRFDGQDGPLLERAHLAEAQGDWAAAAAAWRALVGSGERVWWFYGRLLQAECRQRDLQAAFETFAAALARFPGDLTAVIDFVSILIDNDYREPAREYISEALRGAASTPELIELGQLALRGDETLLAKEAVERLQRGAPHGPQFAERIRELEATLADRAAVEARERADQASVAAVRPAEQPSGKATAQRPGGGDSWLRRAAGLLKGRPAAGEVRGRDGAMNG